MHKTIFLQKLCKGLLPAFLFQITPAVLKAQNYYGLQNSNFNGYNAIYINPAGIADSRWRFHAASSFGNHFSNDYVTVELPFSVRQLLSGNVPSQYKTPSGNIAWDPNWFKENLNGKPKNAYLGIELRGPGAMYSITKKLAVGVGMRTRFGLNMYNISENFVRFAKSVNEVNGPNVSLIQDNQFTLNISAYQEYNATAALVLHNKEANYLKVGASTKYLQGLGAAYIINEGINFEHKKGPNGADTVIINKSNIKVGHSSPEFIENLQSGSFGAVLPKFKDVAGSGLGIDIGAVYEFRPDFAQIATSKNMYLLRAGLSILDIGAINYKNKVTNYSAFNTNPVRFYGDSALSNAFSQGIDSGLSYMESYARNNFNYKKGPDQFKVAIPTTVNIQLDYNVFKWFYIGLNWTQALARKSKVAFRRPSNAVLIPRFEHKLVEASVPLSFYNDYKDFGMGFFLRIGPVFMGSDNLIKSVNRSSFNGYDFYIGIASGIPMKKSKRKQID